MSLFQLLTAVGSEEDARSLARSAVDARAASCVQVLGPVTSIYRWKGRVEEEREFLCLMKVPSGRVERLVDFVRTRHPYETPEITVVESVFTDERYLVWAEDETGLYS